MSASLAVEHLLQISSRQRSKVGNATQNDEAPSRTTPRRTRSRSERNKAIKRQLEESALAQVQLSLDAQGTSAAVIPPRIPLRKERRNSMTSNSFGHKQRGSCQPTSNGQHEPLSTGNPDASSTSSIRAPRRSLSQPMALKHMQTSLDPQMKSREEGREIAASSSSVVRPPRSPLKMSRLRPGQDSDGTFVSSSDESELVSASSASRCDAISVIDAPESPTLVQSGATSRDERRERRLLRRNRSASLTSPKRVRSMSSRRTKNVQQLVNSGDNVVSSGASVDTTGSGSNSTRTFDSSSYSVAQEHDQMQSSIRNRRRPSYPSPKEEPAQKGDSPPAPPRKAMHAASLSGLLVQPDDSSQSSSVADNRWESDTMEPPMPLELNSTVSDSASSVSSATSGLVVSTSTKRRNRPKRTSSITSHGAAPLPRPGLTKRRSRLQRSASDSSMRRPIDLDKNEPSENETTTTSSSATAERDQAQDSTSATSPSLGLGEEQKPPSTDPRPPKAPQSRSRKEKLPSNQQSKPQRGRNFISGLKKSFSFSGRSKKGEKSTTSILDKPKESRRTTALSIFLKNPALDSPHSPANTERTKHTVSTISTELSDFSNLSSIANSPQRLPSVVGGPLNLARLRVEFDKPFDVDRDEGDGSIDPAVDTNGLEIDTHILVAAATSANVDNDPDSILAAHFAKLNEKAVIESKGSKDEDEASDIVSVNSASSATKPSLKAPRRSRSFSSALTRRRQSRSRSLSKKGRRNKKEMKRGVSFDKVYIREYERSLGDSPAVSSGPPIGLGWAYMETTEVPVEHYETAVRAPAPRSRKDFFLSPQQRFHILLDEWGLTLQDICRAKDEAAEIRLQRQVSVFGNANMIPQVKNKAAVAIAAAAAAARKNKKSKKSGPKKVRTRSQSPSPRVPLQTPVPRSDRWNHSGSAPLPPAPLQLSA